VTDRNTPYRIINLERQAAALNHQVEFYKLELESERRHSKSMFRAAMGFGILSAFLLLYTAIGAIK
jgi:hypothetical protein